MPLHAELIRLRFLNYLKGLPKDGRLWPDLKPDSKGKLTGNWSKWWGRYARQEAGITDPRKVFHSFRHTFKDATRAAGIDEALRDVLTGHSGGGVGRTYGRAIRSRSWRRLSSGFSIRAGLCLPKAWCDTPVRLLDNQGDEFDLPLVRCRCDGPN